jgi:hypothetical protein
MIKQEIHADGRIPYCLAVGHPINHVKIKQHNKEVIPSSGPINLQEIGRSVTAATQNICSWLLNINFFHPLTKMPISPMEVMGSGPQGMG